MNKLRRFLIIMWQICSAGGVFFLNFMLVNQKVSALENLVRFRLAESLRGPFRADAK